jgi:hypothetical protein
LRYNPNCLAQVLLSWRCPPSLLHFLPLVTSSGTQVSFNASNSSDSFLPQPSYLLLSSLKILSSSLPRFLICPSNNSLNVALADRPPLLSSLHYISYTSILQCLKKSVQLFLFVYMCVSIHFFSWSPLLDCKLREDINHIPFVHYQIPTVGLILGRITNF